MQEVRSSPVCSHITPGCTLEVERESPLAGGISGVVVFFLLLGGALTLTVAGPQGQTVHNIADLALAPYIALALLAGFASRPFMLKMKDLADSLFALSNKGGSGRH